MIPDYPPATAVVCHDAGAANILIAGLSITDRNDWRAYMGGPAKALWKTAFPKVNLCDSLNSALDGAELLVTGTGWASNIEHEARKLARSRGIRSVAVIDHWVNYAERFIRHSETVWPDEFWVTDEHAIKIAKDTFPGQAVFQVPNRYIDAQLRALENPENSSYQVLLYVLEPMRADWGRGIPGEFQALDYFISHLPELNLPANAMIRLRPHPSDVPGKYDDWIARQTTPNIQLDDAPSLAQSMKNATWVAGCETFALVVALMSGRKVYCTLPPWAPACRLPHQGLIHLGRQDKES